MELFAISTKNGIDPIPTMVTPWRHVSLLSEIIGYYAEV